MADQIDVQAALDELFGTPPERFVAARNALVKQLKADDHPAEAGYVGLLRKPNRLVWALNQLALTEHGSLQDLLDAADDVREGGGDDLKAAMADLRDAVNAAATAATARFDPPRVSDRADLAQALLAIVSDEEATIELSEGRLQDVPPPDAFGLGLTVPAEPRAKPKPKPQAKEKAAPKAAAKAAAPPVDQLAIRRATKHQKEAAKADDSAQRALARAERSLAADVGAREEADAALASAQEEVEQLEAALDAARKAHATAESAAAKAVDAQERSADALSDAQAKADAAATTLAEATAELEAFG